MAYKREANRRASIAIVGTILAFFVYSILIEPAQLFVRDYTVVPTNWPQAFDGLKVAVISDLHVGSLFIDNAKVAQVVQKVNATNPDIVLMLGDYVYTDGAKVDSAKFIAELSKLKPRIGVYAVLGNHDWYFDGNKLRSQLEGTGFTVLENSSTSILIHDRPLWIAGLADAWERTPQLRTTLSAIPTDSTIVLLTHNPDMFPFVPSNVSLTLAGHTHGGQISLPILGPLVVPSHYGSRYARGLIVEKGRELFVTPGIGTSVFPIRFMVPPEISVLTLKRQAQ